MTCIILKVIIIIQALGEKAIGTYTFCCTVYGNTSPKRDEYGRNIWTFTLLVKSLNTHMVKIIYIVDIQHLFQDIFISEFGIWYTRSTRVKPQAIAGKYLGAV